MGYQDYDGCKYFKICEDDYSLEWEKRTKPPTLDDMTESLEHRIYEYVAQAIDGTTFDIDLNLATGFQPSALAIDRYRRKWFQKNWFRLHIITIKMHCTEATTDFSNFASLDRWFNHPISRIFPRDKGSRQDKTKRPRIVLQFDLPSPKASQQLRVKINEFLRLTFNLAHFATVCFLMKYSSNSGIVVREHNIELEQLRRQFFVLLSRFYIANPGATELCCPDIYVDGQGSAIELICPHGTASPGQVFPLTNRGFDDQELIRLGKMYASSLDERCFGDQDILLGSGIYSSARGSRDARSISHSLSDFESLGEVWGIGDPCGTRAISFRSWSLFAGRSTRT
jgi:hypothetical protein